MFQQIPVELLIPQEHLLRQLARDFHVRFLDRRSGFGVS